MGEYKKMDLISFTVVAPIRPISKKWELSFEIALQLMLLIMQSTS
jgi:hypothetical protein